MRQDSASFYNACYQTGHLFLKKPTTYRAIHSDIWGGGGVGAYGCACDSVARCYVTRPARKNTRL